MVALALIAFDLADTSGVRHTEAELGPRAVVVFIAKDCPKSNQLIPDLIRRHEAGSKLLGVYADPALSRSDAAKHARDFRIPFPVLLDPALSLARQLGATYTPQQITVEGGRVTSQTTASGCAIPFPDRPKTGPVTYSKHVAPILARHCAACHQPGESGPFPLLTYADTAPKAEIIAKAVRDRAMPPWLPAPGHLAIDGERRLSESEIRTIARWAGGGAPEGPPLKAPPPPARIAAAPPDLTASMPKPAAIPAGGPDQYRCFVLPTAIARDRWVRQMEFRPGNRAAVHHALVFADSSGSARQRDQGSGYDCFGIPGFLPSASFGGWTPGSQPAAYPEGVAMHLRKDAVLVIQVHYHPTGKPESDQSSVALTFTDTAPTRHLYDIPLGSRLIDIPAGEAGYKVRDHFEAPVDVWLQGVIPHAHYVCREMRGIAKLPSGKTVTLITIVNWDFNWQQQYRFKTPFLLPAGTKLEMEFVYDNSAANPRNPNRPPKRVVWGPDSTDEMAGLHLQVIPVRKADEAELGQTLWGKMMRSMLTGQ